MLVLHPYVQGEREEDQADTWKGLEDCPFEVRHLIVGKDDRWPTMFTSFWNMKHDLAVVEHDIGVTRERLEYLALCPYSHCAVPYLLYPTNRWSTRDSEGKQVQDEAEFAYMVGFGLVKITKEVRNFHLPSGMHWSNLDRIVSRLISEQHGQWHLHWPAVTHHHDLVGRAIQRGKPTRFTPHPSRQMPHVRDAGSVHQPR